MKKKYKLAYPVILKIGKKYLKRTGRCTPKKCNSLCCRLVHSPLNKAVYLNGFIDGKLERKGEYALIHKDCKYLKNNRCSIWKNRPICCYHFPIYDDDVYQKVKNKCGYKYVEITKKECNRLLRKRKVIER